MIATAPDLARPLLALARGAIAHAFGDTPASAPAGDALTRIGATFVTLRRDGALRGCIGTLDAWRPLADDVQANAVAAAFRDPRFAPLRREELRDTAIEVSLLHPGEPVAAASEPELLASLRPGVDGLVLECDGHRATFLPQVWEQLGDRRDFVRALKRKAGLPEDHWSAGMRISRYAVDKFVEEAS